MVSCWKACNYYYRVLHAKITCNNCIRNQFIRTSLMHSTVLTVHIPRATEPTSCYHCGNTPMQTTVLKSLNIEHEDVSITLYVLYTSRLIAFVTITEKMMYVNLMRCLTLDRFITSRKRSSVTDTRTDRFAVLSTALHSHSSVQKTCCKIFNCWPIMLLRIRFTLSQKVFPTFSLESKNQFWG